VAIVSGGSSDVPIASEAKKTLEYYGVNSLMISDVGVAGLWRLTERLQDIQNHKVVICIAGMDAALPTVLGGLISSALIAVPTSVGYGMAEGGETALRALLVSCAPGISVVNIDNGYGAACAAIRILNQIS
jgi:NCAIR mutase (PurE)-related protein